jgi:uncharacterized membrane protein YgdD (TMEM256/DUF423 family)
LVLAVRLEGRHEADLMLFVRIAAVFGFLGVGLGAFGAHALKARLSAEMLVIWHTGVLYHLVHAVALLGVGALGSRASGTGSALTTAGWAFTAGIVVFSGSLYALALSGVRMLGAITPLGGASFLVGWAALVIATFSASTSP